MSSAVYWPCSRRPGWRCRHSECCYPVIGPHLRSMSALYWARFGEWPLSLELVLQGRPVPASLKREAEAWKLIEDKRREAEEKGP